MGDYDREPREPAHDSERVRETDRTTIVHSDGGRRGGGAGIITAVLVALLLIVLLFFLFRGAFDGAEEEINVDVETPELQVPDVEVPEKIEVDVPEEINVDTDAGDGNAAE